MDILEDIALDARVDVEGRLVADTKSRRMLRGPYQADLASADARWRDVPDVDPDRGIDQATSQAPLGPVQHLVDAGGVRLQQLDAFALDGCHRALEREGGPRGQPLAAKPVRKAHAVMSQALTDAVRRNLISRNIAKDAKPPKRAVVEMDYWSEDQAVQFLKHAAAHRLASMWRLLWGRACDEVRSSA